MIKIDDSTTRDIAAKRLGENILKLLDEETIFVPCTFYKDKVIDDFGEYSYSVYAQQILGI